MVTESTFLIDYDKFRLFHLVEDVKSSNLARSHHRIEKTWFNKQFHSNQPRTIVQPHELEKQMSFPPTSTSDRTILNRIRGSIIGLALGDALGAPVEFLPREFLLEHPIKGLQSGGTWGLRKGQVNECDVRIHPSNQRILILVHR